MKRDRENSPDPILRRRLDRALHGLESTVSKREKLEELLEEQARHRAAETENLELLDADAIACSLVAQPGLKPLAGVTLASGPDPAAIQLVHRDRDSWVHFSVRRGDGLARLAAIRAGEIDAMFPEIRDHLLRDAYFTINSMRRPGRGRSSRIPSLQSSQFTAKTVSSLNACYADLDFGRRGLDFWRDVLPALGTLVHARRLPPYSIVADSGHGAWLFWLLRADDDPDAPVAATWSARAQHYLLQRAITDRLVDLGVDAGATDLARSTRVPGSRNSKTDRPVRWNVSGEGGRLLAYRMNELAELLGVDISGPSREQPRELILRPTKRDVDPARRRRGQAGWRAVWTNLLDDLELLRRLRGGFVKGTRNNALFLHARCWRSLGFSDPEIEARLAALNRHCRPPVYPSALRDALASAKRPPRQRGGRLLGLAYRTVAMRLRITREESEMLTHLPAANSRRPRPATRSETIAERREIVLDICLEDGVAPTVRAIAARLRDMGHPASLRTVVLDLDAIGPALEAKGIARTRRTRPTGGPVQQELPVPAGSPNSE